MLDVAVRVESIRPFACNQMVNIFKRKKQKKPIFLLIYFRQFYLKMLMFLFLVQILQQLQKFYMLLHGFVENFVRKEIRYSIE